MATWASAIICLRRCLWAASAEEGMLVVVEGKKEGKNGVTGGRRGGRPAGGADGPCDRESGEPHRARPLRRSPRLALTRPVSVTRHE